jgi:hypothetical protein
MSKLQRIEEIHFTANPRKLAGTADPSAGGGLAAPEGSTYMRYVATAGELWLKTGAAAIAWSKLLTTILGSAGSSVLTWGNNSVAASADTRWLDPGYEQATADNVDHHAFRLPRAGTVRNLRVRHNLANGNGNSVVYSVDQNGVASIITCTLATGAVGDASDLANTVAFAAGDLITIRAVKASAIGSGNVEVMASLEIAY